MNILNPQEHVMTEHDRELRLECLRLANGFEEAPHQIADRADTYYAFVTGQDRAAIADQAKSAIDKLVS